MCVVHWFNLLTIPIIMLWPEIFPPPNIPLWINELAFLLDIIRKAFTKKQKSIALDSYEIFVEYLTSNFIIDLISSVPNMFSGLNPVFAPLKIFRVYEVHMLHFMFAELMRWAQQEKSKSEKSDSEFAMSVLCKVTMLLHYLAFLWIYVGGEAFYDYEPGYLPWQFDNEDFDGMSYYQLYVFSTYWVFTVITTVGYGDYAGGTTLEYEVTLFLEAFGMVVFTVL